MKNVFLILVASLSLASCWTPKRLEKVCSLCPQTITRIDTIVNRDSVLVKDSVVVKEEVIVSKPDSAGWKAFLSCKDGKVVITNTETTQGRKTKVRYRLSGDTLKVNCDVYQDSLYFMYQEHHKLTEKYRSIYQSLQQITTLPPKILYLLRWWHKLFIGIGIFATIVTLIRLAFWLGRNYTNISSGGLFFVGKALLSLIKL